MKNLIKSHAQGVWRLKTTYMSFFNQWMLDICFIFIGCLFFDSACFRLWSMICTMCLVLWIFLLVLTFHSMDHIFPFYFIEIWFNNCFGVISNSDHIMHSVSDPLDLLTNTFWQWSSGLYFFNFIFIFRFSYLICFQL